MSHPPETSRELTEQIRRILGIEIYNLETNEPWREIAALIDAWVRVREARLLDEAHLAARGGENRFERLGTRQLYWKGRSDAATDIRALATARKQRHLEKREVK